MKRPHSRPRHMIDPRHRAGGHVEHACRERVQGVPVGDWLLGGRDAEQGLGDALFVPRWSHKAIPSRSGGRPAQPRSQPFMGGGPARCAVEPSATSAWTTGQYRCEMYLTLSCTSEFQGAMLDMHRTFDLHALGLKQAELILKTEFSVANGMFETEDPKTGRRHVDDFGLPFKMWSDSLPHLCARDPEQEEPQGGGHGRHLRHQVRDYEAAHPRRCQPCEKKPSNATPITRTSTTQSRFPRTACAGSARGERRV